MAARQKHQVHSMYEQTCINCISKTHIESQRGEAKLRRPHIHTRIYLYKTQDTASTNDQYKLLMCLATLV